MTTRHKTVSLRTIGQEHGELNVCLEKIKHALAARQATQTEMLVMLRELARCVREHFEHEELGGYFAQALDAAPWLRERVGELLRDHPEMSRQLDILQEYAARGTTSGHWWRSLDQMFDRFHETFSVHETAENALMQETVCRDEGTKD